MTDHESEDGTGRGSFNWSELDCGNEYFWSLSWAKSKDRSPALPYPPHRWWQD